jgi:hypothetical protein
MKLVVPAALAALACITLTGCASGTPNAAPTVTVTATVTETATVTATPSPSETTTPEVTPAAETGGSYGSPVTYTDGVAVSLSSPKKITLGEHVEYADGDDLKWKDVLLFEVTLTNGSSATVDPVLLVDGISADEAVQQVWDDSHGLTSPTDAKLRAGKKLKWKFAVSVKDPKDVSLDIIPTFDHDPASFANS